MKTETYILPSYLLPYLFNADASGLTDEEQDEYDAWEAVTFPYGAWAVSNKAVGFLHTNDINDTGGYCQEIAFQIADDAE